MKMGHSLFAGALESRDEDRVKVLAGSLLMSPVGHADPERC